MGMVNISIFGRNYQLACDPGQEEYLRELAFEVDERMRQMARGMEGAGEHMLLLLAGLQLADELHDLKHEVGRLRLEGSPTRARAVAGQGQAVDTAQVQAQVEARVRAETEARLLEMEAAMAMTLEEVAQRIERIAEQIEMR